MRLNISFIHNSFSVIYFLFLFISATLNAQESIKIGRLSDQVEFDGSPFEEVWSEATIFPLVVSSPNFGTTPSERSEVMIGYDEEYLWIGARLFSKDASEITLAFIHALRYENRLYSFK